MFKRVLFACDFSASALKALPVAVEISRRTKAELHILYVDVLYGDLGGEMPFPAAPMTSLHRQLNELVDRELNGSGIEPRVMVTRELAAAPALIRYADEHEIDLIVMGTHGRRGFRALLLGSVAEEVIRRASCSVLTVRKEVTPGLPSRILVPIDFTERTRSTLQLAKTLAGTFGATTRLVHVLKDAPRPTFYYNDPVTPEAMAEAQDRLLSFYRSTILPSNGIDARVRKGRIGDEIVAEARESGTDLIVMTTHEPRGIEHLISGSIAVQVSRQADAMVLVHKSPSPTLFKHAVANETVAAHR
jgi:nucleotide-binding universal stress UspA family protein